MKDEDLKYWLNRFEEDKYKAAGDWWAEVKHGIDDAFNDSADLIPDMLTPGQVDKLKNS